MSIVKHLFFIGIAFNIQFNTFSQVLKKQNYSLETGTALSKGKETPFWLFSNQYGLLTINNFNGWVKAGIYSDLSQKRNIDYDYCFELLNQYSASNKLYIHQAYLRLKIHFINIHVGSMAEKFGNQDSSLSSGGILWSGNARPMPKIAIYIHNYTSIPYTKGYLEFKGGMSHGWFINQSFTKNYYLHHKYVYVQFGGKLPVHFHFGMHHFAQWGGESNDSTIGKLPSTFKDFIRVFTSKSGKGSISSPWSDWANRIGNHIGSKNFGLDIDFANYKLGIYWQTIFEDGSGRAYRNISDGLWGIYLHSKAKNKILTGFLYEFLKTTNQSGPYNLKPNSDNHEYGGNDDYFNHDIYQEGWTYNNMTIGTPLITSPAIFYGNYISDYIRNNKIIAHHFAFEGGYNLFFYKLFYTTSLNYGTNTYPFENPKYQHSVMLETKILKTLPWGLDLKVTIALDKGKMYGNNEGIMISILKSGKF